jgi:hypothetical protein
MWPTRSLRGQSIPHGPCKRCIEQHLATQNCPYTSFLATTIGLILTYNFCDFMNSIWQQLTGYATGVANGGEVAHIYLEETIGPVLAAHAANISFHRRYIDDGFLIFTGTKEQLLSLFTALNAVDPDHLELTYECSRTSAVFLDLVTYKGDRWRASGVLDFKVYQKPINRYLYLPFSTETPTHVLLGFIRG